MIEKFEKNSLVLARLTFWQLSPGLWIRIFLMRIRIQLKILMRIRIQIRGWGGGVGQPKMCIPPGKILGSPLDPDVKLALKFWRILLNICKNALLNFFFFIIAFFTLNSLPWSKMIKHIFAQDNSKLLKLLITQVTKKFTRSYSPIKSEGEMLK